MEIKHYTLNTGNMQVVKETEINSNPIFRLKPLVNGNFYSQLKQLVDSARRGEKAHMFDHTYFVIIEDKNHTKGYFCTLYVKRNEEYIPNSEIARLKTQMIFLSGTIFRKWQSRNVKITTS